MNCHHSQQRGFTIVEIMIVVAVIGILASVAIPSFVKARSTAQQNSCIENLQKIEGAKQLWATEERKNIGATPTASDLVGPASYLKRTPECPAGGTYDFNCIGTNATCTVTGHTL